VVQVRCRRLRDLLVLQGHEVNKKEVLGIIILSTLDSIRVFELYTIVKSANRS